MKTYENLRNENREIIRGRTKLFVESCDDDGSILSCKSGEQIIPENSGVMFIVDDYTIDQIHKLKVIDGDLVVKDGETLDVPEKTAEDIEREQLLARLAELDNQ